METDLAALKEKVEAARGADELSDDQIRGLKEGREALEKSAQTLFTKMYENMQAAQGAAGAGPEPGAGAGGADDDVVDADFKEV